MALPVTSLPKGIKRGLTDFLNTSSAKIVAKPTIVFVVLGWILPKLGNGQGMKISANVLVIAVVGAVILSEIIITGFYI